MVPLFISLIKPNRLDLHSTINGGMPSILRLWCAEKSTESITAVDDLSAPEIDIISGKILREQASKIECEVGYSPGNDVDPYSRERSCFSVALGLGSWTVVSLSNWQDHTTRLSVSFSALVSHSIDDFVAMGAPRSARSLAANNPTPDEMLEHGFHVFSFWSSEYAWIPHQVRFKLIICSNLIVLMIHTYTTSFCTPRYVEDTG